MKKVVKDPSKQREGIEIAEDFEGWPIYKRTIKWILDKLGAEEEDTRIFDTKTNQDYACFKIPSELLEKYPQVLEDDGMGYSPQVKYVTDVDAFEGTIRFWIDLQDEKHMRELEKENDDSYSAVPWPEAQSYFNEPWFKDEVCFDSSKNLWFIPNKYID